MKSTIERRMLILQYLCEVRHSTRRELSLKFEVSDTTIENDLLALSCYYPIYTTCGNLGGIHIAEEFNILNYLNKC